MHCTNRMIGEDNESFSLFIRGQFCTISFFLHTVSILSLWYPMVQTSLMAESLPKCLLFLISILDLDQQSVSSVNWQKSVALLHTDKQTSTWIKIFGSHQNHQPPDVWNLWIWKDVSGWCQFSLVNLQDVCTSYGQLSQCIWFENKV